MNTAGLPPLKLNATQGRTMPPGPQPPPPPPPAPETTGDTLQLSSEAVQKGSSDVPDAVLAAVADLQGAQATMSADFRTIGDYFAANGGRAAQDAFMAANFSDAQLRAFPPPTDGLIIEPLARALPEAATKAVADVNGEQSALDEDLAILAGHFSRRGSRRVPQGSPKADPS